MGVEIDIPWAENETAAQLKGIFAETTLLVSGGTCSFPCERIALAKNMKQRTIPQTCRTIRLALFVDQQRKCDVALCAEDLSIAHVAEANRGQRSPFAAECLLVIAQLRNVLAAEDSTIVAKEYDHCGPIGPQRAQANLPSFTVRESDVRQLFTDGLPHERPFSSGPVAVSSEED